MKAFSFWKKLTSKADFWPLLIVLFFSILASRHLLTPGYFNMHDDLQMMRQLEMEKCVLDAQFPCRWVPDMGYGFGFPLFNFYPPLPYITGQLFRLIGFSYIATAKALFVVAFVGSGVAMYFLAKKFFGKSGGILASVFYVWAPYHSVDIFVRGAMNEAWALIFFPLILLSSYKLISSKKKNFDLVWIIALSLSWFGLLTSHNLMVMIFTPIFGIWCLIWLVKEGVWKKIIDLVFTGVLSLGLAAFFTLPVFLEQKLVHANTLVQGYFEYSAHFASVNQILFSRFWGYGPSVWMDLDDKMSFQIGQLHWILSLVILLLIAFRIFKTRKINSIFLIIVFTIGFGWFAAFMTHSRSTPIWQAFEPLKFVQFPWRFLTLVILGFSFAIGGLAKLLSKRIFLPLTFFLSIGIVIFNWNYFKPEGGHNGPLTDTQKFSGAAWDLQRTAGIYDYLPITAKENPREGQNGVAEVYKGYAKILNLKEGTNWSSFDVDSSEESEIRINTYLFPEWKVFVDGRQVEIFVADQEKWGRMYIRVPDGKHTVYAKLYNTPIRTIGNIISLVTWVGLIGFIAFKNKRMISAN